jgi:hypothetical protein
MECRLDSARPPHGFGQFNPPHCPGNRFELTESHLTNVFRKRFGITPNPIMKPAETTTCALGHNESPFVPETSDDVVSI